MNLSIVFLLLVFVSNTSFAEQSAANDFKVVLSYVAKTEIIEWGQDIGEFTYEEAEDRCRAMGAELPSSVTVNQLIMMAGGKYQSTEIYHPVGTWLCGIGIGDSSYASKLFYPDKFAILEPLINDNGAGGVYEHQEYYWVENERFQCYPDEYISIGKEKFSIGTSYKSYDWQDTRRRVRCVRSKVNPNYVPAPPKPLVLTVGDRHLYGAKNCLQAGLSSSFVHSPVYEATTRQVLDNMKNYLNYKIDELGLPKLVIISTGNGDASYDWDHFKDQANHTYPKEKSIAELKSIIDQFQKSGALVVYVKAIKSPEHFGSEQEKLRLHTEERLNLMEQEAVKMGATVAIAYPYGFPGSLPLEGKEINEIVCRAVLNNIPPNYP